MQRFTSSGGIAQPKLAVGPGDRRGTGSVWVTFVQGGATPVIEVVGARVDGPNAGTVEPFSAPVEVTDGTNGQSDSIAVGPSGQVLVSWINTSNNPALAGKVQVNVNSVGLTNPLAFADDAARLETADWQTLLPLKRHGMNQATIDHILVENPRRVFSAKHRTS